MTAPHINDEALREQGDEAEQKQFNANDTSTANQRQIILAALRTGPKTTVELRHIFGIMSPAPRIFELRRDHRIDTVFIKAETPDKIKHVAVALYALQPKVTP
ncbi:MAG: helix-turn-helix domain-containing protein [Burkholderiales bacterium]